MDWDKVATGFTLGVLLFQAFIFLMYVAKGYFKTTGNTSDGYHTFHELYEHRNLLYINLCLKDPERARWKYHWDGWFCLFLETDQGQISYHIQHVFLPMIKDKIKQDQDYQWDGHNSHDVIKRLCRLAEQT